MSISEGIEIFGQSTPQQLADGLSKKILDGEIKPGERIRESVLATSLGISRNTVREAVRLLQNSGLVRYNFNRGLAVWAPSDDEIVDVYEARLHLELAAVNTLDASTDLNDVQTACEEFKGVLATHDPKTIVEKDLAIHQAIVHLLHCKRLDAYYAQLMNEFRYFLLVLSVDHREYTDTQAIEEEHARIVDALLTRDRKVAAEVLRSTIEEYRDEVRDILRRR